jgi:WD40 repeat protein
MRGVLPAAPEREQVLDGLRLQARLAAAGLDGVRADLRRFRDEPDVAEVLWALDLSAAALAADPRQLAGQLAGRLMSSPSARVRELVAALETAARGEPWLRPRTPSLVAPGGPLRRILRAHDGWPAPVALCNGDRKVIAAFEDGTLRLWDAESGEQEAAFGGGQGSVEHARAPGALAVSADGEFALCGHDDGALRLWRSPSGELLLALGAHAGRINSVALLGGGAHALSAGEDGTARHWDLAGGAELCVFAAHARRVTAVAALPGEQAALSAGWDGGLRLWDLATGAELRRWELGGLLINQLVVLDGGRVLAAGEDGTVSLLDLGAGFAAPRARRLAVGLHDGSVSAVAATADGQRALSASADGTLRLWQLGEGGEPRVPGVPRVVEAHTDAISGLVMSADGRLAVSVSADRTVKLWDLLADLSPRRRGHRAAVTALAVPWSGRRVVSGSKDASVRVWDLGDGAEVLSLAGHRRWVDVVALHEDLRQVVSASAWAGTVQVWDLDQRRLVREVAGPRGWLAPVAITADGRYILFTTREQRIAVWDLRADDPRERLVAPGGAGPGGNGGAAKPLTALAVTADSRRILGGAADGSVTVWDFAAGEILAVHPGHLGRVTAIAAAGEGEAVVSGAADGSLRHWNAVTGRLQGSRDAHPTAIAAVAVSRDGRLAATAAHTQLALWDLARGCEPLCAFTADSSLFSCALSPDGRSVVAGEASGRLHFLVLRGGRLG